MINVGAHLLCLTDTGVDAALLHGSLLECKGHEPRSWGAHRRGARHFDLVAAPRSWRQRSCCCFQTKPPALHDRQSCINCTCDHTACPLAVRNTITTRWHQQPAGSPSNSRSSWEMQAGRGSRSYLSFTDPSALASPPVHCKCLTLRCSATGGATIAVLSSSIFMVSKPLAISTASTQGIFRLGLIKELCL